LAEGRNTHAQDVSGSAQCGIGADEALLGGAAEGAGEGEIAALCVDQKL
jgi:hypothetical protein